MPTEVVAQPLRTLVIPDGMAVNPMFDYSLFLGIPIWFLIDFFLVIGVISVAVWWILKKNKLNAVAGWRDAPPKFGVSGQVWMINRLKQLTIMNLKFEDSIFSFPEADKKNNISMWHHNTDEAMMMVGAKSAALINEHYDQTRDIMSEIALTDNIDAFNRDQIQLTEWKKQYEIDDDHLKVMPIESFKDYNDFGRTSLQTVCPEGLPIQSYNFFNNLRFLKIFPKGNSPMHLGGEITLQARGMIVHKKDKGFLEKYALIGIILILVLGLNVAAFMVPMGG